jgi:flavin reductase (DIM6/NTAB) family NADH-FMN oxidoreductase RutF
MYVFGRNAMKEYPLKRAFQLFEPGPVVLVTTRYRGKANVMTMSWHMVIDFSPMIACVIGPWDYTYTALRKTRECVLAVPTVDMAETVVEIGNYSGRDMDKFAAYGLTAWPAGCVKAPLIAECLAHLECRVSSLRLQNSYSIVILEGLKAWIDPARKERRTLHANGDGTFTVDGRVIDLSRKMLKLPELD